MARRRREFIRAAGGVVWRSDRRDEVAVIYRDRHLPDECCLPKGKLDPGEDWETAAEREVREETGCEAAIERFRGVLHYFVRDRPKIVVYFDMVAVREGAFQRSGEVRAMTWLPPTNALAALTHSGERDLLRASMDRAP